MKTLIIFLLIILYANLSFSNNLIHIQKPEYGFELLIPPNFSELEKKEGNDSIFTYTGFGGRASIVIRIGEIKNSKLTSKILAAIYEKKILQGAIPETTESIDINSALAIKKNYSTQNVNGQGIAATVIYCIDLDKFYIFHISYARKTTWLDSDSIINSFKLLRSDINISTNNDADYSINSSPRFTPQNRVNILKKYPVTIDSFPNGAKVYINDKHAGFTPFNSNFVQTGFYNIKIVKTGFNTWVKKIRIDEQTVSMIDAYLVEQSVTSSLDNSTKINSKIENGYKQGYRYYNYNHLENSSQKSSPNKNINFDKNKRIIKNFNNKFIQMIEAIKKFENNEFVQNRPVRLSRNKNKQLKRLYKNIRFISRELNEKYNADVQFNEIIQKFLSLQTRAGILYNLAK